jgi:hypothetical protein
MGLFDFLLTEKQKKQKVATRLGLEGGAFQECPVCRDVTEAGGYEKYAEKIEELVNQRLMLSTDEDIKLFNGNKTELLETVREVAKKLPYHCRCHNN